MATVLVGPFRALRTPQIQSNDPLIVSPNYKPTPLEHNTTVSRNMAEIPKRAIFHLMFPLFGQMLKCFHTMPCHQLPPIAIIAEFREPSNKAFSGPKTHLGRSSDPFVSPRYKPTQLENNTAVFRNMAEILKTGDFSLYNSMFPLFAQMFALVSGLLLSLPALNHRFTRALLGVNNETTGYR